MQSDRGSHHDSQNKIESDRHMIPHKTPLTDWEKATSIEQIFALAAGTDRPLWRRAPEQAGDAADTQRWENDKDQALVITVDPTTGREEIWDDPDRPTGWLALTEEAQGVHRFGKIDLLAHVLGKTVTAAAEQENVFIDPVLDRVDIWTQPGLRTIARYSLSREVDPHPTLGMVLTKVAANLSPHLYIPGKRRAGFNFMACGIGKSGAGKGTASDLAEDLVRIEGSFPAAKELALATFEGASDEVGLPPFDVAAPGGNEEEEKQSDVEDKTSAETPKIQFNLGPTQKSPGVEFDLSDGPVQYDGVHAAKKYNVIDKNRHLARVDELSKFIKSKHGGNAAGLQALATIGSSESLGAHLVSGTRDVPRHSYRIAIYASIQPQLSGDILRDNEGVQQRFVWLLVNEPDDDTIDHADQIFGFDLPGEGEAPAENEKFVLGDDLRQRKGPVAVDPVIRAEIKRRRRDRKRRTARTYVQDVAAGSEAENGQRDLLCLRLSLLVSVLLYGEISGTIAAWTVASALMDSSEWARESTLEGLAERARSERVARTADDLAARQEAEEAVDANRLTRAVAKLRELAQEAGPTGITVSQVRKKANSRMRRSVDAAVDELVSAGQVTMTEGVAANGAVSARLFWCGGDDRDAAAG